MNVCMYVCMYAVSFENSFNGSGFTDGQTDIGKAKLEPFNFLMRKQQKVRPSVA
jgi:hypothetical protein